MVSKLEARQDPAVNLIIVYLGGVATPLFLWYTIDTTNINMDRGKLKNIVKSLQSLLDVLESEVYSDVDAYSAFNNGSTYTREEDDDDGYPD